MKFSIKRVTVTWAKSVLPVVVGVAVLICVVAEPTHWTFILLTGWLIFVWAVLVCLDYKMCKLPKKWSRTELHQEFRDEHPYIPKMVASSDALVKCLEEVPGDVLKEIIIEMARENNGLYDKVLREVNNRTLPKMLELASAATHGERSEDICTGSEAEEGVAHSE